MERIGGFSVMTIVVLLIAVVFFVATFWDERKKDREGEEGKRKKDNELWKVRNLNPGDLAECSKERKRPGAS